MDALYKQIGLDFNSEVRSLTFDLIRMVTNTDYRENRFMFEWPFPDSTDTLKETLDKLAANKIIVYRLVAPKSNLLHVSFFVTNRYNLEKLKAEFNLRYSNRPIESELGPGVNNLIYYNPSTGDISVNGRRSRLKQGTTYRNRAIFGLILRYLPKPAPREEVLKTLQLTSKTKFSDEDRTYGINHAIDNLRDALGVKSGVISLKTDRVHLNATCVE